MEARFHPDAERELEDAAVDMGGAFVDAVEAVVERVLATPGAGASWPLLPPELGVRRRDLPPHKHRSLAYTVIDDVLWIVAVVHERRRPGYWIERLDSLPR